MKIGIFVTAYNVEQQIVEKVLSKIPPEVMGAVSKIIIIDNKSTDATVEVVDRWRRQMKLQRKIDILCNNQNYGYGGSHKVAFTYFIQQGFDYAIMLHGDGQGDPRYLTEFLDHIHAQAYDFIVGSRFLGANAGGYSFVRRTMNIFFSWLQGAISGLKLSDPGSGFIAYRMATVGKIPYVRLPSYFYFDPSLFLMVSKQSPRIKEFPIVWGKVEQSSLNVFEYGAKLLLMLIRYRFSGLRLEAEREYPYSLR